jgi:mevalonate kinase
MTYTIGLQASTVGMGHAHGKAILVGEHTVVYGLPAIAIPLSGLSVVAVARAGVESGVSGRPTMPRVLDREHFQYRFTCGHDDSAAGAEFGPAVAVRAALQRWWIDRGSVEVSVGSSIPPARGLGSSAALAAAAVCAVANLLAEPLEDRALFELVQCGEQVAHGRASGVDAATVVAPGPVWFEADKAHPIVSGLDAALVLADSGIAGNTRQAVQVARGVLGRRADARQLLATAATITERAATALKAGQAAALGCLMTEFHALLQKLGVSTAELDRLVFAAQRAGAHGAKLTGGGLGGCVLALTERENAAAVGAALAAAGAQRIWTVPAGGWLR